MAACTQAEYVMSGERLEAKVLRQLKRALQPVLKQPVIEYGSAAKGEGKDNGVVVQAHTPDPLPAVFEGECVIAYSFLNTSDTALYVCPPPFAQRSCFPSALCFHVL